MRTLNRTVNNLNITAIPNGKWTINERREKVFFLTSQGLSETEIAEQLGVGQSTISRDLKSIKKQSQKKIESIIEDLLPYEYSKCIMSVEQIIKEGWKIYHDRSGKYSGKNKLDALKLIRETNRTRHEILMEGPFNLRALQMVQKVEELVKEEETPRQSYMNLRLPALIDQRDVDSR